MFIRHTKWDSTCPKKNITAKLAVIHPSAVPQNKITHVSCIYYISMCRSFSFVCVSVFLCIRSFIHSLIIKLWCCYIFVIFVVVVSQFVLLQVNVYYFVDYVSYKSFMFHTNYRPTYCMVQPISIFVFYVFCQLAKVFCVT